MDLTEKDIGNYYIAVDVYDKKDDVVCKFIKYRGKTFYCYEMEIMNGRYKNTREIYTDYEILKQISEVEALAKVL